MARGWESKSVEAQQAEASASKDHSLRKQLTAEEAARARQSDLLELARKRALQQLEQSSNPLQRKMLEAAIADLDQRIAALQ
jgi:hypothetical protein